MSENKFTPEESVEKYFSSRHMSREEYDFVTAFIKSAMEKPADELTELEKGIRERVEGLPEKLPEDNK